MPTPPTQNAENTEPNLWYLAYGSNLSSETFRGRRGIRPLAQVNVIVPSLELTFDLPGFPYLEPCFANVRRTNLDAGTTPSTKPVLIGVAYLITPEDYARVIATEGGGLSYKETAVECWRLPKNLDEEARDPPTDVKPLIATHMQGDLGERIVAYTLLAPDSKRWSAPLQPSKRYINIIQAGARENLLPASYIAYLDSIPYYRITSVRQRVGASGFLAMWMPAVLVTFLLNMIFADPKTGKSPSWLGRLILAEQSAMWRNYERVWKRVFGSGETTESDGSVNGGNLTDTKKEVALESVTTRVIPTYGDLYRS